MDSSRAMTAAERTRKRRKRLKGAGFKLVQVWLTPDAAAALESLKQRKSGASTDTLISHALWLYDEHG